MHRPGLEVGAEHGWGHHEWGYRIPLGWKHLTDEQQKTLALGRMDIEIEHVESHIRLMQEELEILKSARNMLKGGC